MSVTISKSHQIRATTKILDYVRKHRQSIFQFAAAFGIPPTAVASVVAEEYRAIESVWSKKNPVTNAIQDSAFASP